MSPRDHFRHSARIVLVLLSTALLLAVGIRVPLGADSPPAHALLRAQNFGVQPQYQDVVSGDLYVPATFAFLAALEVSGPAPALTTVESHGYVPVLALHNRPPPTL